MELVAFLGADKENWGQVSALIKNGKWDGIVLIKNSDAKEFPKIANETEINIFTDKPLTELRDELKDKISRAISRDFEVALSIASGTGKEHMALVSALLNIPVGVRLAVFTKKGVEFIN